jgi:hypothetical protein
MTTNTFTLTSVVPQEGEALTVTAEGVTGIDSEAQTFGIVSAPTFSDTPDSVTASLLTITFTDKDAYEQHTPTDEEGNFVPADWLRRTTVDIAGGDFGLPNEWMALVVEWTAVTDGLPKTVTYSPPLYWPKFAAVGGNIVVTGYTNTVQEADVLDVDVSGLTNTLPFDTRSVIVSLVNPDGTTVEIPPDGDAPSYETISFVGLVSSKAVTITYPTHAAGDTEVTLWSGPSLDVAGIEALGYNIVPGSQIAVRDYTTVLAWRRFTGSSMTFTTVASNSRTVVAIYRGLDATAPIAGFAASVESAAETDIVLAGLASAPASSWIARFRGVSDRLGTMPADAALTARGGINDTSGTFYAFALSDSDDVAASVAAATVGMGFASRSMSYVFALRAAEAA